MRKYYASKCRETPWCYTKLNLTFFNILICRLCCKWETSFVHIKVKNPSENNLKDIHTCHTTLKCLRVTFSKSLQIISSSKIPSGEDTALIRQSMKYKAYNCVFSMETVHHCFAKIESKNLKRKTEDEINNGQRGRRPQEKSTDLNCGGEDVEGKRKAGRAAVSSLSKRPAYGRRRPLGGATVGSGGHKESETEVRGLRKVGGCRCLLYGDGVASQWQATSRLPSSSSPLSAHPRRDALGVTSPPERMRYSYTGSRVSACTRNA